MSSDHPALGLSDLFSPAEKVCVVTGGGTGIGLMIAQGLAENGAKRVYITGRRAERLKDAEKTYSKTPGQIVGIPCDITDQASLTNLAHQISTHHKIDLLICNAGISAEDTTRTTAPSDPTNLPALSTWLQSSSPSAWHSTLTTNLTAQYFTIATLLPHLTPTASIITISSVSGIMKNNSMGQFAYAASKAGLIHLTRNLAWVLRETGVRVNGIAPGLFPSEMTERRPAREGTGKSELGKERREWQAGRPGREEDVVAAVLWLAGRGGEFVTGQTVVVDGGLVTVRPSAM
ncbi:NAD(P)-binding protein [Ascodesmis nigricans]|uniref:NAD(P)-binding protein n=1 Tax=Ascodesmis nigricans TaxID=341454 RepID=A0A4S2N1Q4_9PEZI|nr:NAD(P)-binding protein [Ascodesmis nigricans]